MRISKKRWMFCMFCIEPQIRSRNFILFHPELVFVQQFTQYDIQYSSVAKNFWKTNYFSNCFPRRTHYAQPFKWLHICFINFFGPSTICATSGMARWVHVHFCIRIVSNKLARESSSEFRMFLNRHINCRRMWNRYSFSNRLPEQMDFIWRV